MLCPICNGQKFADFRGRAFAQCVECKSLERHRIMWSYLQSRIKREHRVLHFAPEKGLRSRIEKIGCKYDTGDLNPSQADEIIDILRINKPSDHYDIVICSHVLEHVIDDFTAMQEIWRVLVPGGFAILQVPLAKGKKTYRDPYAVTKEQRLERYGQEDHVRIYGDLDYPLLLHAAGFSFEPYYPSEAEVRRYVYVATDRSVHIARKAISL